MLVVPWSIEPMKISDDCIVGVVGGKRIHRSMESSKQGIRSRTEIRLSSKPQAAMLNKSRGDTACGVLTVRRIGGIMND